MTAKQYVPHPTFQEGVATDGLMAPSNARGEKKRFKDMENQTRMRVQAFKKYADRFIVPTTIARLQSDRSSPEIKLQLDKHCIETLEPLPYSRPFSAMYYDQNKSLLFSYMGERWKQGMIEVRFLRSNFNPTYIYHIHQNPPLQPLKNQYQNRTLEDLEKGLGEGKLVIHDGIYVSGTLIQVMEEGTQRLYFYLG
jgi:hypothetical protein